MYINTDSVRDTLPQPQLLKQEETLFCEDNGEDDWVKYKCKSGQTIFLYNKVTGVHKWPPGFNNVS